MLEAINLGCVRGDRRLFGKLNFSINKGAFVEVRGPNGGGKTSLLRIICGLMDPAEGEVRWCGENIRRLGEEYFGAMAYIAHQNGVKDELTAIENLRVSAGLRGIRLSRPETRGILERIGLGNQQHLPARLLSAGQRRRLALARLLTSKAPLWILDEISTSLDDAGLSLSRELMSEHLSQGGLAIVATHQDLNLAAAPMQRIELAP